MTKLENRRNSDKAHVRFYCDWMGLPAYRCLSCHSRALLFEILSWYRPANANEFELSQRKVAGLLGCSRATAAKAITELEDKGWTECVGAGSGMVGAKESRAARYALTCYPADHGTAPTNTFRHWIAFPKARKAKR